jgi:hypothetical protein
MQIGESRRGVWHSHEELSKSRQVVGGDKEPRLIGSGKRDELDPL